MNLIIKRIILISVFLLPFIILPRSFYGAVFSKSLFIEGVTLILATLFLIGKLFKKEKDRVPKNIVFLIFGSYVLLLLISCLNGVLPSLSFWGTFDQGTGVIFMILLLVFSLITSSVFKKIEDWYKLFAVFAFSGVIFTLASLSTELGIKYSKVLPLNTVSGFLIGNSSWTGVYMAFVFFISLGLAFSSKIKWQKIIGILGVITAFFNPTLTGFIIQYPGMHFGPIGLAQTASYSMLVGIGLFSLYLIFRKISSIKWRKIFIGSFLSLVLVGVLSMAFIGLGPIRNLIAEKAGPNRLVFWSIAIEGFKEKPLLGWGGDSYQFVYGKYFNPIVTNTPGYAPEYWVDRSHNIFFDELSSGGILCFVALISLYGVLLWGLIRKAIRQREKEGILYMALFTAIISFLIQGLMLFQTITGWFILSLIIVFVANLCFEDRSKGQEVEVKKNNKNKNKSNDNGANIFISLFIVGAFFTSFIYLIVKPAQIDRGLSEFPLMRYDKRLEFYKKLDNSYIGNTVDIGNAFNPYHIKLRRILKSGVKDEERDLMIKEIKEINILIANALKREKYMDMKLLMSGVGFNSILAGIAPIAERQKYHDDGMFYVDKMSAISDKNPVVKVSKGILDLSLNYGQEGVTYFDTEKQKK